MVRYSTVRLRSPLVLATIVWNVVQAVTVRKFNAGGLELGDYEADPVSLVSGVSYFHREPPIPGLTVGNSHRWGDDNGFSYEFPIDNGEYDVELVFAEVYFTGNGQRVFSVALEDEVALADFDVFKAAGAKKEVTKSIEGVKVDDGGLTIAFIPGVENPMISAITIKATGGEDLSLGEFNSGEGVGSKPPDGTEEFDHQAHAVTGGPYKATDFNGDGVVTVAIDGTLSHSHYNNPDTGESGFIAKYTWKADGFVISNKPTFESNFKIGITDLELTVEDQTGDVAKATTTVTALGSTAGGAYCYYYPGETSLPPSFNSGPKPTEGYSSSTIDFEDDEFQYIPDKDDLTWASRCLTNYTTIKTGQVKFSVKYQGAGAALYVNGALKASGGASNDNVKTISATVTVQSGITPLQILYYRNGETGSLQLLAGDKLATSKALAFKNSAIVPTISGISPNTVDPNGAGQLQIMGTGLVNSPKVFVGDVDVTDITLSISAKELVIKKIPSQAEAGGEAVPVYVTNGAGTSNQVTLTYNPETEKGVAWEQTYLKINNEGSVPPKYGIKQITSVAIGPDFNYYFGALTGVVLKISAGKNLVVTSQCTSQGLSGAGGPNRAILSVAFYPKAKDLRLYATSNSLYWKGYSSPVDGWANGAVETFTSGCGCLCLEGKLITGLPVSNHDHGVNQLVFLDNGDLLIAIGGATNAGVNTPGNKLGNFPETELSGAVVLAKLSKGASFDGNIKYDQYANAAASKVTSGDVELYATGLRNCFGMTKMTNGEIWATDNGGNFGYGDVSKSCTEDVYFSEKQYDEVNKIEKGKYYGHPNRNRGECVHSQFGGGTKPVLTMISSTPGIVEYTSNAFGGGLKGELILSKYAASGNGATWRFDTSTDSPVAMSQYSGLSIANGLHGELIMPRVQQGFVAVLKPIYPPTATPMMIAVSPRSGTAGQKVFVAGENFKAGMKISFGGKAASQIDVVDSNGAICTVPSGSGKVAVTVDVGGVKSASVKGYDFIYL